MKVFIKCSFNGFYSRKMTIIDVTTYVYSYFSILRHGKKTSLQYELCITLITQARDRNI
jgi:hypothetical protein